MELVGSLENPEECSQIVAEMNKGSNLLSGYSSRNVPPKYLNTIKFAQTLSFERDDHHKYPEDKELRYFYDHRLFEKVYDKAEGIILSFPRTPTEDVQARLNREMEGLGLISEDRQENVKYRGKNIHGREHHFDEAYRWTFHWLNGPRPRSLALEVCKTASTLPALSEALPCDLDYLK